MNYGSTTLQWRDQAENVMPPSVATVEFTLRIGHLDFASITSSQNALVRFELTNALKWSISSEAGDVVTAEHVDLSLSAGSVIAEVSIKPPASTSASVVQSNLNKNQSHMLSAIVDSIRKVGGIRAVSTGPIGASIIRKPTVRQVLTTTAAPATEPAPARSDPDAGITITAFIVGMLLGGSIACVLACTLGVCLGKYCATQKVRSDKQAKDSLQDAVFRAVRGTVVQDVVVATPVNGLVKPGTVKGVVIDNVVEAV